MKGMNNYDNFVCFSKDEIMWMTEYKHASASSYSSIFKLPIICHTCIFIKNSLFSYVFAITHE